MVKPELAKRMSVRVAFTLGKVRLWVVSLYRRNKENGKARDSGKVPVTSPQVEAAEAAEPHSSPKAPTRKYATASIC